MMNERYVYEELHSCYTCKWECLDGCCMKLGYNGDREPVPDEPIVCEMYEERDKEDD